jgi:hypothetical protein
MLSKRHLCFCYIAENRCAERKRDLSLRRKAPLPNWNLKRVIYINSDFSAGFGPEPSDGLIILGEKNMKSTLSLAFLITAVMISFIGLAEARTATPVSPGDPSGIVITQSCPTFSWSAAENATSYIIEIYKSHSSDLKSRDEMFQLGAPLVRKEIPVPALSWTPSEDLCLTRGTEYIWYVRGAAERNGAGDWSEGMVFELEESALSIEQQEALHKAVSRYISEDLSPEVSDDLQKLRSATETDMPATLSATTVSEPLGSEGTSNTLYGYQAGLNLTSGFDNVLVGAFAGKFTTSGRSNAILGHSAGISNVSGYSNSYFGQSAGYMAKGSANVFLGSDAGFYNSAGHRNVFIGYQAGMDEPGSNLLYIDNCVHYDPIPDACTKPFIKGNFYERWLKVDGRIEMVTVATPSDVRYKREIRALESSLDKVLQLQGVTYEWNREQVKGAGFMDGKQIGLIAQAAEKVLPELVYTDEKGYKTLSYDKLAPVLIEAIKEQQKEIDRQQTMVAQQQNAINEKDARIAKLEKALDDQQKSLADQQNAILSIISKMASLDKPAGEISSK